MKKLSFSLLGIIVVILSVATFLEKYDGTDFVNNHIYGAWWFSSLWMILALSSFAYMLSRKLQRNLPAFLLHFSFFLILAGALLTSLTAQHGIVHLRMNEPVSAFITNEEEHIDMPFTLTLDTFVVSYYPGTNAEADYISKFTVSSPDGGSFQEQVSMNRIFSYHGIRFYQASYDSDRQGNILTVNCDRWGIPVTYAGYFFLFAMMLWNLCSRNGYFRRVLRSGLLKRSICVLVLLGIYGLATAGNRTLTKVDATYMGQVQVLYNGRIAPLQTLAYDFTQKLTGKMAYKGNTAEQIYLGWLLFSSSWQEEPMIYVKDAVLRDVLGFKEERVSLKDFFTSQNEYRLEPYLNGEPGKLKKAAVETDEKIQLLSMLHEGELFKVFPVTLNGQTVWYAPASMLPPEISDAQWLFIRKGINLLAESVLKNDSEQVRYFISKLITYQQKNGGESLLPERKIKAERLYNHVPFATLLYRINLTVGLLAFFVFCFYLLKGRKLSCLPTVFTDIFSGVLWLSFLTLSFCLLLRGYISGRWPMGNGYETMMMMAWCILLTALIVWRRFRLMLPFGLLLSGFCLLVSSIGQMNPQITPLVPVLSSPLLSLHVSLIMMSYALFSFTFLNGLLALILNRSEANGQIEILHTLSQLFLVPALFLLGAGIFIGAIWANVSWGRYWAWDPKEVWALITFLVYAFALHTDSLRIFRKPLFFHVYMILSFLTILMTYFGVNYFLGGMHSYAG